MTKHFPQGRPRLSRRALSIWAKTVYRGQVDDDRYLRLTQHLSDTGETALHVWDEFVADDIKAMLTDDIGSRHAARELYRFIASVHDIGKASPAFVVQSERFADETRRTGLRIDPIVAVDRERSSYRHELVGYVAVLEWFGRQGFPVAPGTFAYDMACVVAGHHGTSLTDEKKDLVDPSTSYRMAKFIGDDAWSAVRNELLDWVADTTGTIPTLQALQNRPMRRRTQIILTSLVVVADWIASDSRLFPLNEGMSDEVSFDPVRRADRAWRMLRLPEPWHAHTPEFSPDEMFADRFVIPGAHLRPVQREAARLAQTMESPGLMIVEANMGEGKTEAALIAAEILANRFHCGGIYYALPSQATVNAMFARVLSWISRLPVDNRPGTASLYLAHGKNELNDDYERLREQWFDDGGCLDDDPVRNVPSIGIVDTDDNDPGHGRHDSAYGSHAALQAVVNSWLTGRRRGNLSGFVVGTIDQILMTGLKSKYVVLRHLALAGKVVILDEIHSNTAYMNVYMTTVLSWLGAYGVPVIMLSATLPQERREEFLRAYRDGARAANAVESRDSGMTQARTGNAATEPESSPKRSSGLPSRPPSRLPSRGRVSTLPHRDHPRKGTVQTPVDGSDAVDLRYPLISLATASRVHEPSTPKPSGRAIDIDVSMLTDDDDVLVRTLREKLRDGGCAVVIRDTVSRAQSTYQMLRQEMGRDVDIMLAHSRFLACDRARIDRELLARYGKHGSRSSRTGIVVATQVVEQSLDVDFDLMITDIAPIDLILQRAGRLHRHHRGDGECDRPEPLRKAALAITGIVKWSSDDPPEFAPGICNVYQRCLLLRSLSALGIEPGKTQQVNIPGDIPRLVQSVYGRDPICRESWRQGRHGEIESMAAMEEDMRSSRNTASRFRIFQPQYADQPFDLNNWLREGVSDPEAPGVGTERAARAGVREGEDSFEVIVLQQHDGELSLPVWGDFPDEEPLPNGVASLSRRQVRDILSCSIALSRTSLGYLNLDSVIGAMEAAVPERWYDYMQADRSLAGQLLVALDDQGSAAYEIPQKNDGGDIIGYTALTIHYSKEKGWQADVRN